MSSTQPPETDLVRIANTDEAKAINRHKRVHRVLLSEGCHDPARRRRDLDSLDQHVGSVGRQRFQVVRIGCNYGPSGFRECHDKCIDRRPTAGQSPQ
jgi:hypothetical protein